MSGCSHLERGLVEILRFCSADVLRLEVVLDVDARLQNRGKITLDSAYTNIGNPEFGCSFS